MAKAWRNRFLQDTGWMFAGQGMRAVIQAAYFILIARALGAEQYGAFVAISAMASLVSPFVGLGAAPLLVKNVSRNPLLFCEYWGNGLLMICGTGCGFLALMVLFENIFMPKSVAFLSVLLIGISDLLFTKVCELAWMGFQAVGMMRRSAQIQVLVSAARLVGIALLSLTIHHPTAGTWAVVYLAATVVIAIYAVASLSQRCGIPSLGLHRVRPELAEGLYFSWSVSAQTIYNDVDKTMLARMVALDATGIYAAAYRIVDVAFTPVRAMLSAAYPRFFRQGSNGIEACRTYGLRLTRPAALYSLAAAAAMLLAAPLLPHILGQQFARTAEALRWLSLLPLLKTFHYFMADALTGAGYQKIRTLMQVIVAVFNVLLNLWLIPAYGWRGAAWSSLATDGLLGALMYAAVYSKCRGATATASLLTS